MSDEIATTNETLLDKNIRQWTGHCEKLEAREDLTEAEQDDLEWRRMQIKRWKSERGDD